MKKGDIVRIKAAVITAYGDPHDIIRNPRTTLIHCPVSLDSHVCNFGLLKSLYKQVSKETFLGVLIGKTYLATGKGGGGYNYDDPAYLSEDKRHSCWLVEPLLDGNRYLKPIHCLEEDLELVASLSLLSLIKH